MHRPTVTIFIFMHEDLTEGNNKILLITEYHRKAEQANKKADNNEEIKKKNKIRTHDLR